MFGSVSTRSWTWRPLQKFMKWWQHIEAFVKRNVMFIGTMKSAAGKLLGFIQALRCIDKNAMAGLPTSPSQEAFVGLVRYKLLTRESHGLFVLRHFDDLVHCWLPSSLRWPRSRHRSNYLLSSIPFCPSLLIPHSLPPIALLLKPPIL